MITILKGTSVEVHWRIIRTENKITEDFTGAELRVFLAGPDNVYPLEYGIVKVDGYNEMHLTVSSKGLSTGVYDLKAVWVKNKHSIPDVVNNQFMSVSRRGGVLAVTNDPSEVTFLDKTIKLMSYVESYGRDGMSAYELAAFRGVLPEGMSEAEWANQENVRQQNEEKRIEAEDERREAEDYREAYERARKEQESDRVKNENDRKAAEEIRQATFDTNEEARQVTFNTNESKREAEFGAAIQNAKNNLIVVNDLTTGGADKALSAEMGKELGRNVDTLVTKVENIKTEIVKDDDDEIIIENNNGERAGIIKTAVESTYTSEQRWESNDGNEIYAKINENGIDGKVSRIIPAITIPSVVEPSDDLVDVGYSSPIGRNNVIRANWAAENKYTYYDFLSHYYDCYLGEADGYSLTKRSLGSDTSNAGYELFEYDFRPLNYKKVVMISAGMNTCETGALWGLVTFIKAMMTSDEEGFKFLRENVRFKVLPMICPSSFDKDTLAYPNANGVRINKNFDYCRKWYDVGDTNKGEYPDSEQETKILKKWLNDNAWTADLYIDCHQDPDKNTSQVNDLTVVICSDSDTNNKLKACFPSLVQFYRNKGYIPSDVTPNTSSWVEGGAVYPKTKYAKDVCGIPAIMIEQYCSSTMYGSDGNTINDVAGIKNYAAMLRLYTFAILSCDKRIVKLGDLSNIINR